MSLLRAGFKPVFDLNFYQTNWTLTDHCNYHCSYCVNKHKRTGGFSLAREIMLRTLDNLRATDKDQFFFALEGGESTLYKHLDEMLEHISSIFADKRHFVRIISNGSATVSRMRELLDTCDNSMFIITLHLEQINLENTLEKLLSLREKAGRFLVKLLIAPGKLREGKEAVDGLRASGFSNFRILHTLDFMTGMVDPCYAPEEMEAIAALRDQHSEKEYFVFFNEYSLPGGGTREERFTQTEGVQTGLFNYQNMFCAAGSCSIKISPDGSFARTGYCGDMPYSLKDKNPFADPAFTTPLRCPNPSCICVAYAKLPKWREDAAAPAWLRREQV